MSRRYSIFILLGMALGVLVGWACNTQLSPAAAGEVANNLKIIADIFLRLIKMIIAPLVFSSLVAGIANMGAGAQLGRMGARTILWFLGASVLSLTLGLFMVHLLQPAAGLNLPLPPEHAQAGVNPNAMTLADFITHVFPRSIVEAMATNEILQIVVFSLFIGVALAALGERTSALVAIAEQILEVMLKVTSYVMLAAPLAVFAAIAATIAKNGLGILLTYVKFVGGFYLSMGVLWVLLLALGSIFLGRRIGALVGHIRDPILLAFSTASSEAAYPR
ncbi:MAG: dicarboxylate/amino acid:cation symporter, partial [Hyphomonadaceae bacterium]